MTIRDLFKINLCKQYKKQALRSNNLGWQYTQTLKATTGINLGPNSTILIPPSY